MNAHKKFLNELRAPVRKYNRIKNNQHRKKATMKNNVSTFDIASDEIMKEVEAKFDELFGTVDDE